MTIIYETTNPMFETICSNIEHSHSIAIVSYIQNIDGGVIVKLEDVESIYDKITILEKDDKYDVCFEYHGSKPHTEIIEKENLGMYLRKKTTLFV